MTPISESKILQIDYGNYFPIAERLGRADGFKEVFYFCPYVFNGFPDHRPIDIGRNVTNVTRVKEWASVIDEVEYILFSDSHEPALQVFFESIGKKVFGCKYGCELEHNRKYAKELMKEMGLPLNEYYTATGVDELESVLKEKNNVYVKSSLRGDMETFHHENYLLSKGEMQRMRSHLGTYQNKENYIIEEPIESIAEIGLDTFSVSGVYPYESLSGIELKDTGYAGMITPYSNLPRQLRNVTDKFSDVFRELRYNGAYSNEVIISTDKKGYLLDKTCFSSDTEVLTDKGWKYFYELEGSEKVCTLNPENRNIEYYLPSNYISYNYEGKMISISNKKKTIECLITPNHSVWRTDRHGKKIFEERADSLSDKGFIPRVGEWQSEDVEYFELPEYHHEWDWNTTRHNGYKICTKVKHELAKKIKMDTWVAFLAWYLSEGSLGGTKSAKGKCSTVNITQIKNVPQLISIVEDLGFKYRYTSGKGVEISSVQLSNYLSKFGRCDKKYVPDYIKNLSKRQIQIFLDNYRLGDGSAERLRYFTTSKKMADDLQELCLKAGRVSNICEKEVKGTIQEGLKGNYRRKHNLFIITEYSKNTDFWFETGCRKERYINEQPYNGLVYDVTVKNHILYVRRNGKPFWSGNCRFPSPPCDLMLELYTNFPQIIADVANGIVPVIQYKYRYGVQLIIKSDIAQTDPSPIIVPDEVRNFVKVKNLVIDDDGTWYFTPMGVSLVEIGSVIGMGNSIYEAVEMAKKVADSIKGFDIKINTDCIEDAMEQIRSLKKIGINYLT